MDWYWKGHFKKFIFSWKGAEIEASVHDNQQSVQFYLFVKHLRVSVMLSESLAE